MSIPATIASLATLIVALRSLRKVEETNKDVVDLKKNTDGMHSELMALTEGKARAEGKAAGVEAERDRPISQVPGTLQTQLDTIETIATESAATSLRNEAAQAVVADDLEKRTKAADQVVDAAPGEAADEAARSPKEE